jgi:hypothetical protein
VRTDTRPATFTGSGGDQLAARLDLPDGEPLAFALFAHCFTCSKDLAAATRISRGLADRGFGVRGPLTEEQRVSLLAIADRCPVHRTLTGDIHIRTRLLTPSGSRMQSPSYPEAVPRDEQTSGGTATVVRDCPQGHPNPCGHPYCGECGEQLIGPRPPMWSSPTEAIAVVRHAPHLRRTLLTTVIVGTLLFCINQLDVVLAGDATTTVWLKSALTYVVPFAVSNVGILIATHRRR